VLIVVCGVLTVDEAYQAINHDTITLLLGMMILVGNPQNMLVGIYFGWMLDLRSLMLKTVQHPASRIQQPKIYCFFKKTSADFSST